MTEQMTWILQTNAPGITPAIFSEYVLNDLGVFIKQERRVPKNAPLHAVTGFRAGYTAVPGTDYRAAPAARDVILWHKVTAAEPCGPDGLVIRGNRNSEIYLRFPPENRADVLHFIENRRNLYPPVIAADPAAASWLCWRDDDDWGDPYAPLAEMIESESGTERYIEPEILEETVLPELPRTDLPAAATAGTGKPKFCSECGAALYPDSLFCEKCGCPIRA